MPGYTPPPRAVPSTVGLWLAAFAESFIDNAMHLGNVRQLIDACPLGTAAGYGVNLDLDRKGVADELRFARLQLNAMYAQNSRGKYELLVLGAMQTCLLDIRRFAWDLSLFTTEEFGFVHLPDKYTTGSSIMPNKRNPDVVELLRSAVAVVTGAMAEIESIIALPSGYQRDLQGTKAPMIRGITRTIQALALIPEILNTMKLDRNAMRSAFTPAMFATDLAIEQSAAGVPFREAYQKIGRELEALKELPIEESIAKRTSLGGAGNLDLDILQKRLDQLSA
jgi:argininosuccinate lyase